MAQSPILIATRGSALALAQSNQVMAQCRAAFPELHFELKIIKTTGDKLQSASLARESRSLPKGLFTKELEVALLEGSADLAVHSLKDLPTELPAGLMLGAVGHREDVRDVLIYRDATLLAGQGDRRRGFAPHLPIRSLPTGAVVATSSTRRQAQLRAYHPGLQFVDIRGNVATRLRKLLDQPELDATVLALAGMTRLQFSITPSGAVAGNGVPEGLLAVVIDVAVMLPCVGQAAVGIEIREQDERLKTICRRLNHAETLSCVTAERAFLAAMGGGCQSPVGAHAQIVGDKMQLTAVSFLRQQMQQAQGERPPAEASALGQELAAKLK